MYLARVRLLTAAAQVHWHADQVASLTGAMLGGETLEFDAIWNAW
jgi:hypothetical protein